MKNLSNNVKNHIDGPILDKVKFNLNETIDFNNYPFSLDIIKNLKEIKFHTQVTFFVGENGSGKSTILEAIASKAGFGSEGGSRNFSFKTSDNTNYLGSELLGEKITLSWRIKPKNGYFFRAESFFNVASYIDSVETHAMKPYAHYGGKSLHKQSHGESFLSFFNNRLGQDGFFILDEPEAALSPEKQLSLLVIINEICKNPNSQFIIATHSPILLAYPNATIYSCDSKALEKINYTDTKHYQITKRFLDNPNYFLNNLFEE